MSVDTVDPYRIVHSPLAEKPWVAEVELTAEFATSLIESQFPPLSPVSLEPMGAGWDNTAYLVNGDWVFRFPRRTIAVPLLETEARVLPALAPRLPVPIPRPEWFGRPDATYRWPFLGYRRLAGRVASDVDLDEQARAALARPLARFLRRLHDVRRSRPKRGARQPDAFGRLDPRSARADGAAGVGRSRGTRHHRRPDTVARSPRRGSGGAAAAHAAGTRAWRLLLAPRVGGRGRPAHWRDRLRRSPPRAPRGGSVHRLGIPARRTRAASSSTPMARCPPASPRRRGCGH
jgi:hypothetical protein